jgi:hypothetical protein
VVVYGNGGFLVVSLLKALLGDRTFSKVKTQDLTILVKSDDGVCTLLPWWRRRFGVPYSKYRCSHHLLCSCCCESPIVPWGLCFLSCSSDIFGCVHP